MAYRAWIDTTVRVPPIVAMEADVRLGGAVRIEIETGGVRSVMLGRYLEVEPNRYLHYTWCWLHRDEETQVTVTFDDTEAGCRLCLTHEGFSRPADREAHALAWEAYLQQLTRTLAQQSQCLSGR